MVHRGFRILIICSLLVVNGLANGQVNYISLKDTTGYIAWIDSLDQLHGTRSYVLNDSLPDGTYVLCYDDDTLHPMELHEYSGGCPHGRVINYFYSGEIRSEGQFLHGVPNGIWKTFDEDNLLWFEDLYIPNDSILSTTNESDFNVYRRNWNDLEKVWEYRFNGKKSKRAFKRYLRKHPDDNR